MKMQQKELKDDDLTEYLPKEAIEISESEPEDKPYNSTLSNREINFLSQSTNNHLIPTTKHVNNKVKQQEERLCSLEQYVKDKVALPNQVQPFEAKLSNLSTNQSLQSTDLFLLNKNERLKAENHDLISIIEQLKKDCLDNINKNLLYQGEISQLRKYNINYEDIQERYAFVCNENTLLNNEKSELVHSLGIIQQQLSDKDCELLENRRIINQQNFQAEIEEYSKVIKEKNGVICALQAQIVSSETESASSQNLNRNLEAQLNSFASQFKTKSEMNMALQEEAYQSITKLTDENSFLKDHTSKLQQIIVNMTKEKKQLESKYSSLQDNHQDLYERSNRLKDHNSELQGMNQTLNEFNHQIKLDVSRMSSEFNLIKEHNKREIDRLLADNENTQKENKALSEEIGKYQIENNRLNLSHNSCQMEVNTLKAKMKDMKSENESLLMRNSLLESQLEELKHTIKVNHADFSGIKERLAEIVANHDKQKLINDTFTNERCELAKEINQKTKEVKDRDNQLKKLIALIKKITQELIEKKVESFDREENNSHLSFRKGFNCVHDKYFTVEKFISKISMAMISMKEAELEQSINKDQLIKSNESLKTEAKEYFLLNNQLQAQIENLEKALRFKGKENREFKSDREAIQSTLHNMNEQQSASRKKEEITEKLCKELKCQSKHLHDTILLYENIKKGYEDIFLKSITYGYYQNALSTGINELIKANSRSIHIQREKEPDIDVEKQILNETVFDDNSLESKVKEAENCLKIVLKEIKPNETISDYCSLPTTECNSNLTKSFPFVIKTSKKNKLAQELSESMSKLRSSYYEYTKKSKR